MEFKRNVAEICKDSIGFGSSPVELQIIFHPRDKRLMDVDNCLKAILDSMNGIMYDDDQQVWKLSVERGEKIKGGGCQVSIKSYQEVSGATKDY